MNPQTENHEVKFQADLQALKSAASKAAAHPILPAAAKDAIGAAVRVIEGQQAQIDMLLAHIVGEPGVRLDEAGMPMLAIAADDNPATGR